MPAPPALLVTDYRLVHEVLRSPDFTVDHPFRATRQLFGPTAIDVDGPRRRRMRSHVTWFTSGRMHGWQTGAVDPVVADLVDGLPADEPFDFMARVARLLPTRVVLRVLGCPDSDADWVWERLLPVMAYIETPGPPIEAAEARDELEGYVRKRLSEGPPPGSVLHLLTERAGRAAEPAATDTVIRTALLLLAAGTRTTEAATGNLMVCQLRRPGTWAAVRAGRLAPSDVVRESLRRIAPLRSTIRFAATDTAVGAVPLARGAVVELDLAAANLDPAVFARPEAFDPGRPGRPLLSFGAGQHACVGAQLALSELETLLAAMARRFATMEAAPGAVVTTSGPVFHQPERLDLVLGRP